MQVSKRKNKFRLMSNIRDSGFNLCCRAGSVKVCVRLCVSVAKIKKTGSSIKNCDLQYLLLLVLKESVFRFSEGSAGLVFSQTIQKFGKVRKIEFVRQESRKHKLSDQGLALGMPILFSFEHQKLLLWLVEFQGKTRQSFQFTSCWGIQQIIWWSMGMRKIEPLKV